MAKFVISAFADEASDLLDLQIKALKRNNLNGIEPRSMSGNMIKKSDAELLEISHRLKENGILISSLGSPIGKYDIKADFSPHLEEFYRAISACKILGCENMRIFSFFVPENELDTYRDEVFKRMEKFLSIAKDEGVRLCHENEAKIYGEHPDRVQDLLDNLDGLFGIFDGANYVVRGLDPVHGYNVTHSKLEYMHVKDAIAETRQIVPVGMGDGEYQYAIEKANLSTDKTVFLTVEPHLKAFLAYNSIDDRELKTKLSFENSDESFDFAVTSLKKLLTELGYKEENYVWTK